MPKPHETVAEKILELMMSSYAEAGVDEDMCVEDYNEHAAPAFGISISPAGEQEKVGTTSRDDIEYITVISRNVHTLGSDDLGAKSFFRDTVRRIFHNKRINISDTVQIYSRVDFGAFAIPKAWTQDNRSVTAMQIYFLARERRNT